MQHILVTGGAGFFGGILKNRLLRDGYRVTSIDRIADSEQHPNLFSVKADIRDKVLVDELFARSRFDGAMHCAAVLAHGSSLDEHDLWTSNVDGTRCIAEACRLHGVRKLVFTSTNCLWAAPLGRAVREDDEPLPIEIYGKSKLAGEQVLSEFSQDLDIVTLRCPTIIDSGRLGLLAILFEFIHDNKTVWVVGEGSNKYQFVHAQDLATACIQALRHERADTFHIGSDNVKSLREVFQAVIDTAESRSRVRSMPKGPTLAMMQLAHKLKVSPLGPYHYRMIAEDFIFDTTRIREGLQWTPTLTNEQMLTRAYQYYAGRRDEIHARTDVSAHNKPAAMGIIRLLKWVS